MASSSASRRKFIKQLGSTAASLAAGPFLAHAADWRQAQLLRPAKRISPNDRIRIATIGMGIMGYGDTETALKVPGVELAGVCDLYEGRLDHAKELYGSQLFTTRRFQDILDRKDIDAVIIATSDNWHDKASVDRKSVV